MEEDYFADTYQEAREKFLKAAKAAGAKIESLELKGQKGPEGETLAIDIAVLGDVNNSNPESLLLHTSGVHGPEGFAGSAIQTWFLTQLAKNDELRNELGRKKGTKIALVHAVNPYGMAWIRRYNENNVDLNRNFLLDPKQSHADIQNVDYPLVHEIFKPSSYGYFGNAHFMLRLCKVVAGFSFNFKRFKQAVAGGQYDFKDGFFYGGDRLQPGPQMLVDAFKTIGLNKDNKQLDTVLLLDIHTGLGKNGVDILITMDEKICGRLGDIYGKSHIQPPTGDMYKVLGSTLDIVESLAPTTAKNLLSVCQEFGTIPMLGLNLGWMLPTSLKSMIVRLPVLNALLCDGVLNAMLEELVAWCKNPKTSLAHKCKDRLKAAFYDQSTSWKRRILHRGRTVLCQSLSHIGITKHGGLC
eukprot:jgi/Bigna1/88966/estExt_fgenesh1_pg.C_410084